MGPSSLVSQLFADSLRHLRAGRPNEAERICRQALAFDPRHADSLYMLGLIAYQVRRFDAAIDLIKKAIAVNSRAPSYHWYLGNALKQQGKLDDAIVCYRRTLELKPAYPDVHNNLGVALRDLGRLDEAEACYRVALGLKPDFPEVLVNLGVVLMDLGRLDEAEACYHRALELKPDFPEGLNNLGAVLKEKGGLDEAVACYRGALELKPAYAEAHNNLGAVLKDLGRFDEAVVCYRRALKLKPDFPEVLNNFGNALWSQGRFDEAAESFETALLSEADSPASYYGLSQCWKFTPADLPLIADMERLLADRKLTAGGRAMLHFALGKILDDLAEYETAIGHFDEANRIEGAKHRFDRARSAAFVDRSIDAYPEGAPASPAASESEMPILIVGMPRSGTTLAEQILASHPRVAAGGELDFWFRRSRPIRDAHAGGLDAASEHDTIGDYLGLLTGISHGARRVTDKMPYNAFLLGLVHRLFPKARIIHCRRNPIDTALSIYFTRFAQMNEFAYSRSDIAAYYRDYLRLMAHWRRVLPPDRFIEIDYEELVADPEAMSRRLVAFCGLDWDDACLDFHKTDRPIGTASAWQARQPIYRTSAERWRRYEPWLGELRELIPLP